VLKPYAYGWITLAFFLVSISLHWMFGWFAYVDEAREHGQSVQLASYLVEMTLFWNWSARSKGWNSSPRSTRPTSGIRATPGCM